MAGNKSSEEKYTVSEEASFVRSKILKYCKEDCFSLTPEQIDTVINLYKKYDGQSKQLRTGENVKQSNNIGDIKVRMDFLESIKGLKAIQREARKATAALKGLGEQKKDKYLIIELDELGDVPRVIFKGEEITMKEFINFQWTTRSDIPGNTDVIVDYFERNDGGLPISKSIREGISS